MKINKEFILKNLITICCIASVLLLILPFCAVIGSVSSDFLGSASDSETITGFEIILGDAGTLFGWLLILCPAVLVSMNYIDALEKYKSVLAIVLPIVSIISAIATLTAGKKAVLAAMGGSDTISEYGTSISVKLSPQIGFYLLIIAYIATFIAGAMTYHGLTLDKKGIAEFGNKIKETGLNGMESAKDFGIKVSQKAESVLPNGAVQPEGTPRTESAPQQTRFQGNTADTIALLENLAKMKENGILTEEEFQAKKQELLKNI